MITLALTMQQSTHCFFVFFGGGVAKNFQKFDNCDLAAIFGIPSKMQQNEYKHTYVW